MKIVMVGPVYPYKTGLSYYVGLLYKQLKQENDVVLLSYSMQYPKILYKKPQKDYKDDVVKIEEAEFILNSANPFSWLSVAKRIKKEQADLVIFQWLHPYFAPCYWSLSKLLRKTKILYICHNAIPHERFVCDRLLTKLTLKNANYIVAHSNSDAKILKEMLPVTPIKVNPHPTYNFFKIKNMTKDEGRQMLGLKTEDQVLLFFGLIREYKGLKHLIKALPYIANQLTNVKLVIAGDFSQDKDQYLKLIKELKVEKFVDIYAGHIPIPEVEKFFAACDLVVLPYESATQSGVVQSAYGFEKPVLATRVGGLPDVVEHMKTGYLVESKNPQAIAEAVIDYFENQREEQFSEFIKESAYKFSWQRMEDCIKSFLSTDKENDEK